MLAKGFEGGQRGLDHGDVVGSEDLAQDLEDILRKQGKILGGFLDQGCQYLQCDLDVARRGEGQQLDGTRAGRMIADDDDDDAT